MFVDGKPSKTFLVHQLVKCALPLIETKDHINGDKFDNRKTNTRWLDGMDNIINYHEGRRKSVDGGGKRGGDNGKKGF